LGVQAYYWSDRTHDLGEGISSYYMVVQTSYISCVGGKILRLCYILCRKMQVSPYLGVGYAPLEEGFSEQPQAPVRQ
jgi:hypothetical protein